MPAESRTVADQLSLRRQHPQGSNGNTEMTVMKKTRALCCSLFCMLVVGLCTVAEAQQQYTPPTAQQQGITQDMATRASHTSAGSASTSTTNTAGKKPSLQNQVTTQSAQLLALAHKLNVDLDKSNANELSVAVVKDAAEIEKLAKSIRKNARDMRKHK